ncbi:hypothetical protein J6590_070367 [Homalodisca vitripennis]|nr:hypothetical protein J6590_070367 [Homalodisca vitripennis]
MLYHNIRAIDKRARFGAEVRALMLGAQGNGNKERKIQRELKDALFYFVLLGKKLRDCT